MLKVRHRQWRSIPPQSLRLLQYNNNNNNKTNTIYHSNSTTITTTRLLLLLYLLICISYIYNPNSHIAFASSTNATTTTTTECSSNINNNSTTNHYSNNIEFHQSHLNFITALSSATTTNSNEQRRSSSSTTTTTTTSYDDQQQQQYIIMFKEYYDQDKHLSLLKSIFKNSNNNKSDRLYQLKWKYIKRVNGASHLPSDFALVSFHLRHTHNNQRFIDNTIISLMIDDIVKNHLDIIKYIFPDRIIKGGQSQSNDNNPETTTTTTHQHQLFGMTSRTLLKTQQEIETTNENSNDNQEEEEEEEEEETTSSSLNPTTSSSSTSNILHFKNGRINDKMIKDQPYQTAGPRYPSRRELFDASDKHVLVSDLIGATTLWEMGYTGTGTRIGIFDSGFLSTLSGSFGQSVEVQDFTGEGQDQDKIGHGTAVTSIIGCLLDRKCHGIASGATLDMYKVFTQNAESRTSWFIDGFNLAISKQTNIINLSVGGKDYLDKPFIDKIKELHSLGIIIVSASGNDGPNFGTHSNPADQLEVIGVGSITENLDIAKFSSRGFTNWELQDGHGRFKPDLVTYGERVYALQMSSGELECKERSGTSFSAPIVSGAIALLLSSLTDAQRKLATPSLVKQVLIESSHVLKIRGGSKKLSLLEQGGGVLDVVNAHRILSKRLSSKKEADRKKFTVHPPAISFGSEECPYFWPYCAQPLYYGALPTVVNVSLYGSETKTYKVKSVEWLPDNTAYNPVGIDSSHAEMVGATGHIGLHIFVHTAVRSDTNITGQVEIHIEGVPKFSISIRVPVIVTPPRQQRILWDQFHNMKYPQGYFPSDHILYDYDSQSLLELFDWAPDHPHSNFKGLFERLRARGYYMEISTKPLTCFDARNYGTLLIVDPEEEFHPIEAKKLEEDISSRGLNVIVVGDWHNHDMLRRFTIDDAGTIWKPVTGGANVPAINDLLFPYGILLGDTVYDGAITIGDNQTYYSSGSHIIGFPHQNSVLVYAKLNDQSHYIMTNEKRSKNIPILGFHTPPVMEIDKTLQGSATFDEQQDSGEHWDTVNSQQSSQSQSSQSQLSDASDENDALAGTIAVFGDSSCLDQSTFCFDGNCNTNGHASRPNCFWMIEKIFEVIHHGGDPHKVFHGATGVLVEDMYPTEHDPNSGGIIFLPERFNIADLANQSRIIPDGSADTMISCPSHPQIKNPTYRISLYGTMSHIKLSPHVQSYAAVEWKDRVIPQRVILDRAEQAQYPDRILYYYAIPYFFVIIIFLLLIISLTQSRRKKQQLQQLLQQQQQQQQKSKKIYPIV
ncbi:membrane-bound transcription factor peptidase [Cavenderia fasciculata]|uniref:Membrane-bound transcription factor peptidase n=1 Tax=Cavenderia fasciculata TaxID=261658 RepID=F4PYI6_CACFS|nr:membrane-bound transcription factor peptidase [Cavenderia fasciculata]EGG19252.1 membrane-bound transcription factor peptidase [Cavenderia fasciculata]|eukprot:XP_004357523.1 membrane-bound transcription factor peptidase [Cavenderia fasciculata]